METMRVTDFIRKIFHSTQKRFEETFMESHTVGMSMVVCISEHPGSYTTEHFECSSQSLESSNLRKQRLSRLEYIENGISRLIENAKKHNRVVNQSDEMCIFKLEYQSQDENINKQCENYNEFVDIEDLNDDMVKTEMTENPFKDITDNVKDNDDPFDKIADNDKIVDNDFPVYDTVTVDHDGTVDDEAGIESLDYDMKVDDNDATYVDDFLVDEAIIDDHDRTNNDDRTVDDETAVENRCFDDDMGVDDNNSVDNDGIVGEENNLEETDKMKKYHCKECGKVYQTKSALNKHFRRHTGDLFKCKTCGKAYTTRSDLKQHTLSQHKTKKGEGLYPCKECYKSYCTKSALNKHFRQHTGNVFNCETCNESYTTKADLQQHILSVHVNSKENRARRNQEVVYICKECNKRYDTKSELSEHRRIHTCNITTHETMKGDELSNQLKSPGDDVNKTETNENPFLKDDITNAKSDARRVTVVDEDTGDDDDERSINDDNSDDDTVDNDEVADYKYKLQEKDKTEKHLCKECGKVYQTKSGLNKHFKYHTGELVMCETCGKVYTGNSDLKQHMRSHGIGDKDQRVYKCTECDRQYQTQGALNKHFRRHTGNLFMCEFCGKGFITNVDLKKHIMSRHSDDNVRGVLLCAKQFKSYWELLKHVKVKHVGEKSIIWGPPYDCKECPQTFSDLNEFEKHSKGHCVLFCDQCNKQYSSISGLNKHMRYHIGNVFSCTQCDKKYSTNCDLEAHIKSRHSETAKLKAMPLNLTTGPPFQCPDCPKSFSQLATFRSHYKWHSMKGLVACDQCDKEFTLKSRLKLHKESNHGPTIYQCSKCCKHFSTKRKLKRHMMQVHKMSIPVPNMPD